MLSVSNSCDPVDCSLPGSSVHGILQARILEQVAISFSKGEGDFFFFINLVSIQLFKKSICIYISRIIFKCLSISKHLNVNQIPLFCMVVFRNLKKLNEIIGNTENIIIFSCTCHIKMYIKIVTKFIRISLFKI